ncbi:MAG: hypothetical protein NC548_22805 [Lachnospiraceae bacterium]|nr:hypothetical protein [Lachnospiraceae bacterium]
MPRYISKYSKESSSEIRYNIIGALDELAVSSGVDIKTIQSTAPYSFVLSEVPWQKIMVELKKMIDAGLVVKGVTRGQSVKYMLKSQYDALFDKGILTLQKFGYGDYRDHQKSEEEQEEERVRTVCARFAASAGRKRYPEEW